MSHLEYEIRQLKSDIIEMWELVQAQLVKTREAIHLFDKDLAREVISNEKRVNSHELKIDRDCENIIALFNPVAIDLRFVLAVLKINSNLERTGDIVESISKFVLDVDKNFDKELLTITRLPEMLDIADNILSDVFTAFNNDDTKLARSIFSRDEKLDEINNAATKILAGYIKQHPENIHQSLNVISIIRKLERIGDLCSNISEEIIFFVEAKVLKHAKKKS